MRSPASAAVPRWRGKLFQIGIRRSQHPRAGVAKAGADRAGPAMTLQLMPSGGGKDQFGAAEYDDPEKAEAPPARDVPPSLAT